MPYVPTGPLTVISNMDNPYTITPLPPPGSIINWFIQYADGHIRTGQGTAFIQAYWTNQGTGKVGVTVSQTADNPGPTEWITIIIEPEQP